MTKDKDLIDFINRELGKPKPTIPDLDLPLPSSRAHAEWLRDGTAIMDVKPSPYRRKPEPPYRCICGTVFPTAEELLDHRHPRGS